MVLEEVSTAQFWISEHCVVMCSYIQSTSCEEPEAGMGWPAMFFFQSV